MDNKFNIYCKLFVPFLDRLIMITDKGYFWGVIFIVALVVDSVIISWVVVNRLSLFVYIMVAFALGGLGFLYRIWNKDERTDTAIDNSSRLAILIFVVAGSVIGSVSLLLSDLGIVDLWQAGATLIICVLFVAYTLLVLAGWNEHELR